jgi:hypothetical protein
MRPRNSRRKSCTFCWAIAREYQCLALLAKGSDRITLALFARADGVAGSKAVSRAISACRP